jgi:hypothetical protein
MGNDDGAGTTIGDALDAAVERYGDQIGYVFENGEVSYSTSNRPPILSHAVFSV